jgi:gluconolactonase
MNNYLFKLRTILADKPQNNKRSHVTKIIIGLIFACHIGGVHAVQQCNWYSTLFPLCVTTQTGWGWESSKSCIARTTCSAQPSPYGIVGTATSSVASSIKSSTSSKASVVASSKSSIVASSNIASSKMASSKIASSKALSSAAVSSKAASSKPLSSAASQSSSLISNTCIGTAPQGELMAQRITGANTTRSGLYEGPVWIKGALYFSDFTWSAGNPSQIQKLDINGVMTTAIKDSGSNGLAVDAQGDIVAGTHKYKSVSRFNIATGARTSVAEQYAGNVFNSPNDLTIAKDGTLYFTDPGFQRDAAPGGQPKTRVYSVKTNGTIAVVDDSIIDPNGISLSPAEDVLYVNGGTPAVLRAYPIVNGIPQAGKNLVTGLNTTDGMAVDCLGNIYVAEHNAQHLRVFTAAGQEIATIKVNANVTNAAFGGVQGKTLYITGAGAVWKIELNVTGSPY